MNIWVLDQDDVTGLYSLVHDTKGSLKDLSLDDLDILATMFDDEVVSNNEADLYDDDDDLGW